ncbi:Kelch repeat-containing protein [Flavicella marina]|uniref:Kelch repeat-containing protein n=1 Tax=Flavicella marina TaxID=1475951 RepID=UPI001263F184|nr:kelch repeat-containing protein [Flavicella marina]
MQRSLVFLVLIGVSICLSACKTRQNTISEVENKKWEYVITSDGSHPIKRHEAAFVVVGDKFYLLGGRGIRNVSVYDTNTNSWSTGKKPPLEFHHFQPIVYQNNIYVIGAMTGQYPNETPVPNIYYYNTSLDIWVKDKEIPFERRRGSTGNSIKDGVVYIACGIVNGHKSGHQNWFDSYELNNKEWTVLPNAPRARDHFQTAELNGKIYAVGGRLSKAPNATFTETISEVDVYNIEKKEWSTLSDDLPTERAGSITIAYHNDILVIGGESGTQNTAHNEVEGLNTLTEKWHTYPSLIQGRHGTGAFLFKGSMYIASGCGNRGGSPELTTMEKY